MLSLTQPFSTPASEDLLTSLLAAPALRLLGGRQRQRRRGFCDLGKHGVWMLQAHICKELRQPPAETQKPFSKSISGRAAECMQGHACSGPIGSKRGAVNTQGMSLLLPTPCSTCVTATAGERIAAPAL